MPLLDEYKKYTIEEFEEFQNKTKDKLEFYDGEIVNSSTTSRRHNEIISNIISTLNNIIPKECRIFSEMIEVIFKDDFEEYKLKPDVFVICGDYKTKGESILETPSLIFEIVSPKYETHDTIRKRLIYEKFKVQEYNVIFQNGDIIQHIYNKEEECYNISVCHNRDIFKSSLYEGLNIPVEDIIEGNYAKGLMSNLEIAKKLLDVLDNKTIAEKTGLDIEVIEKLR